MSEANTVLPSMRVDGQVALVTGAGRGIGRGCALALAEAGAEVIAMARTGTEVEAVVAEIEAKGGKGRAVACDVGNQAALAQAMAGLDRLDILVNNAGTNVPVGFLEADTDTLDLMLNLNIRAAFLVAQAAARIMDRQGGGVIIHLSSTFGKVRLDLFRHQAFHRGVDQIHCCRAGAEEHPRCCGRPDGHRHAHAGRAPEGSGGRG